MTANSPAEIEILLHYYWSGKDHEMALDNGHEDIFEAFIKAGLLTKSVTGDVRYRKTEALTVYIAALLSVPFPVQKWVIPTTQKQTT